MNKFFSVSIVFVCSLALIQSSFASPSAPIKTWSPQFDAVLAPQSGLEEGNENLGKYRKMPGWAVHHEIPHAVSLVFPSPFQSKGGFLDSFLPTMPQWYIYRFQYLDFPKKGQKLPLFKYVEVDWNTEGLPRGPHGAFQSPHFDFHFYLKERGFIKKNLFCENNGKTCNSLKTGQVQMKRFLQLPPSCFLPKNYFPDTGSAIPEMGLHNLDSQFTYTLADVNHNPILIYGTFEGKIVFLEASVTLQTLQDVIREKKITWLLSQPEQYQYSWWPTQVSLEFNAEKEQFIFRYEKFKSHNISKTCP